MHMPVTCKYPHCICPLEGRGRMSGSLPNPSVVQNPNTDPAARTKTPSFDQLSKLFSRPLSDAADSLGVCPSVLKKVCYENGLVRWPYRKVLSGKSIEDIKKDAAAEKDEQLYKLKVVGGSNVAIANSAPSSVLSSQQIAGSIHENPKTRFITQQPGKDHQIGIPQSMLGSSINKDNSASSDEFKYGFPSDGLSRVSQRWWGNKSEIQDGDCEDNVSENSDEMKENADEKKENADEEKENADDGEKQQSEDTANLPSTDGQLTEGKTHETHGHSQRANSLSALRKKAVKEGQRALNLGVYRGYGAPTLDQAKKLVLLQIFKSSLPSEWGDLAS